MGSSSSKGTQDPVGKIVISPHHGSSPNRAQAKIQEPPINNNNLVHRGGKNPIESTPTNTLFEEVFLITLGIAIGTDLPEVCVHTKETFSKFMKEPMLTLESIDQSVQERSEMVNPRVHLLKSKTPKSPKSSDKSGLNAHEKMAFRYLYQCYLRLKSCQDNTKFATMKDELQKCKEVIFLHCKRCLTNPDNYKQQSIQNQFIDLSIEQADFLLDTDKPYHEFLMGTMDQFDKDDIKVDCKKAFTPILANLHNRFAKEYTLSHSEINPCLRLVELFSCHRLLAEVFMNYNKPTDMKDQRRYEKTLIGAALSLSSCPRKAAGPFEFFKEPLGLSQQEINTTQLFVWKQIGVVCEGIFRTLFGVVKINEDLRHTVLHWFGCCLETLRGKPELWSAHTVEVFDQTFCSDGFCLNLCEVLLHFCRPFTEQPDSDKITRIRQSYCKVAPTSEAEEKQFCVHAKGLHKEETFVPSKEDTTTECKLEKPYPFISECFFLTQQALYVGYSIVHKMVKLNNNVNRLDKLYNEMKDIYPKKFTDMIKVQLNTELCWYLNIKASVTEYHLTKMCLQFHTTSASWLAQVAQQGPLAKMEEIKLPLVKENPDALSQVPEIVMINISNFISTLLLFRNVEFLKSKPENFKHLLTMIILYMGSPHRLKNPDIRAELAETLEVVLPKFNTDGTWEITPRDEALFIDHPMVGHLAETLLNVFVTIEMTGQNVDAEKKYNYRKSMHKTLQFIWKIPLHRMAIKGLADDAMKQIDDAEPPLFLRFINLLINDAIFLLDEALDHMKQIKEQELERDSGGWNSLSVEQLRDKETGLRYLSMIGKHRNIMANYTIYTLEIITRDIRDIFCHPVMVDRIASMLNYFFLYLVGPKQKDYKVRARKELEFKPEQIVSDIAHMYLYLGKKDNFCKAVIGETRSFSHEVFQRAAQVLNKIGLVPEFISRFEEFCSRLMTLGVDQQKEEEIAAEAPDEFLDPIMGTLMVEPVILPTSNKTVDKEVIRRHLLSDQCDPYNRQPLTFDMIIPNTELKEKIEKWLADQKNSA